MRNSNPYNIKVGGYAPCQGELELPSGEYCYIRSRGMTSIEIADSRNHWDFGATNYAALVERGYMENDELVEWATYHIDKYLGVKSRNFTSLYNKLL